MGIQQMLLGAGAAGTVTGQVEWDNDTTLDYTTTWTVPTGVEKISVLCIGRGGQATEYQGGGGGGLTYANNISVTAGDTLNIRISGGYSAGATVDSAARWTWGSRLYKGSLASPTWAVIAYCGHDTAGKSGTSVTVSATSNTGGDAGDYASSWAGSNYGGAGGAAGYAGAGGDGSQGNNPSSNGAGGGCGGGMGRHSSTSHMNGAGGGGGTGRFGQGSNGSGFSIIDASSDVRGGRRGQGGSFGTPNPGGDFSAVPGVYGGGNGRYDAYDVDATSKGGKGLVRIIYPGDDRYYPTTQTGNL